MVDLSHMHVSGMPPESIRELVQELQVHQIELELQNQELQEALAKLELANERFIDLYDFAPVGYVTLDRKGEIQECNIATTAMLEQPRQNLIGQHLALSIIRSDRDLLHIHLQRCLQNPGKNQCCRVNTVREDGTEKTIHIESQMRQKDDSCEIRSTLSDVTQTRLLSEALEARTEELSWADKLPALLCLLDTELVFRYANASHENYWGIAAENLKGKPLSQVVPKQAFQQMLPHLTEALNGTSVAFEFSFTDRTGCLRQFEATYVPNYAADRNIIGLHGLCLDITARKQIQIQRERRSEFEKRLVQLDETELRVYELLVKGQENKRIALELDLGLRTVERKRQSVFQKLQVDCLAALLNELADIQSVAIEK